MNKQQRRELNEETDNLLAASREISDIIDELEGDEFGEPIKPGVEPSSVVPRLQTLLASIEGVQGNVGDQHSDEEDKLDNMPDSWRDGEKGDAAREIIDYLDSAGESLQEAVDTLSSAIRSPNDDLVEALQEVTSHIDYAIDQIGDAVSA